MPAISNSWSPEARAKRRTTMAKPEVRARQRAALIMALNRPEVKAKIAAARRAKLSDPDAKAEWAAASKRAHLVRYDHVAGEAKAEEALNNQLVAMDAARKVGNERVAAARLRLDKAAQELERTERAVLRAKDRVAKATKLLRKVEGEARSMMAVVMESAVKSAGKAGRRKRLASLPVLGHSG